MLDRDVDCRWIACQPNLGMRQGVRLMGAGSASREVSHRACPVLNLFLQQARSRRI